MGYKALLVPYEHIAALSDTKRCYRLSDRTVALLLTQTEYLQWRTRWAHDAQPLSDDEWLLASELAAQVERELAQSDDGMQFRVQNCLLQYRCGENNPWQTLVDLSACRPSVPVSVRPDGAIEIGETVIDTGAPLGEETVGTPERPTTIPIQPVVTVPGLTPCEAAVNLARALVELHTRMCDRLNNPNQFDSLSAAALAAQLIVRFFKFKWLLDVLDALSDAFEILNYCRRFDVHDEEELACMILQVTTIVEDSPVVNRGTLAQLLLADGREQFAALVFLINYLNDSALNYAAAQPLGKMTCPCGLSDQFNVWVISGGFHPESNLASDQPRSRWWSGLGYNRNLGLTTISLRFDNVAAVQGLPSIGFRINAWNSYTRNNNTRSLFYVHRLIFSRLSRSTGQIISSAPVMLRIWDSFDSTAPRILQGLGSIEINNVTAAQISSNTGVEGFNNNDESWYVGFSIRTAANNNGIAAWNTLGQTSYWNRYP